jgi:glyoxylase-like metal-dependent hydrolase (beta-lactamase superfamily II)
MKQLLPGIWQWAWFSPEKQLDFNGLLLTVGEHRVLIDPPPMADDDRKQIRQAGQLDYIIITNRDHEREAARYKSDFHCQVMVPELDAAQMEIKADKTYRDGELLPGGIWAVQLNDQKAPGESALFLQQGKGILIVGDALIGKPPGSLSMLPAEKYADRAKAQEGLRRLLKYHFDAILVGDGASILSNAKEAVSRVLQA